ncbi:GTPase ObgE [Myxococcota bacterium]|mgnify:CR=1 FL=1|nr:GTPase ObgE [Myxococcota bacterium]
MRFIDEAVIVIRSGRGGNGCVSFRREKFVPKGGPDGGDGGRGGDVVLEASEDVNTLLDFHQKQRHAAEDGRPGGGARKTGRRGRDCVLKVPVGTIAWDDQGEMICDLSEAGARAVLAPGGHGGKGNCHFALPWRQAPDIATPGGPSVERTVRLELKLLADVGLVGLPNAGKSTLINRISAARAKVADYPFSTLVPALGVVRRGHFSFVVADLPGLIEGASQGAGLGIQFLRHCERTRLLVHLVDVSGGQDPVAAAGVVENEMARHGARLDRKPVLLVASKIDLAESDEARRRLEAHAAARGVPFFPISARTGEGVEALVKEMARRVQSRPGGKPE